MDADAVLHSCVTMMVDDRRFDVRFSFKFFAGCLLAGGAHGLALHPRTYIMTSAMCKIQDNGRMDGRMIAHSIISSFQNIIGMISD